MPARLFQVICRRRDISCFERYRRVFGGQCCCCGNEGLRFRQFAIAPPETSREQPAQLVFGGQPAHGKQIGFGLLLLPGINMRAGAVDERLGAVFVGQRAFRKRTVEIGDGIARPVGGNRRISGL